jgi:hypothetical protein
MSRSSELRIKVDFRGPVLPNLVNKIGNTLEQKKNPNTKATKEKKRWAKEKRCPCDCTGALLVVRERGNV